MTIDRCSQRRRVRLGATAIVIGAWCCVIGVDGARAQRAIVEPEVRSARLDRSSVRDLRLTPRSVIGSMSWQLVRRRRHALLG